MYIKLKNMKQLILIISFIVLGLGNLLGQGDCILAALNADLTPDMIQLFGELPKGHGVKAWKGLDDVGSVLKTDRQTLSFFSKLNDFPTLQTKLLNDLDDVAKSKFVDDLADAPDEALTRLSDDLTIVEDWKITKNLNPVAGSGAPLPKKGNSKNVNLASDGNPATDADWDNFYENEAGDILAQKGYDIEQSPNASNRTDGLDPNKDPDFKMNSDNGLFFDGFSPRKGTSVRNIQSRAVDKLAEGQAKSFVINLGQWGGSLDDLLNQFKHWPQKGIRQVIVIDANKNVLNILQ